MAQASLHKVVSALPASPQAGAVYFVRVGKGFDIILINGGGSAVALNLPEKPTAVDSAGYRQFTDRIERLDFATGAVTRCMTADPAAWANRAALVYT